MKIVVVGAGGFVGRPLSARLAADGEAVIPIVRTPRGLRGERAVQDIGTVDWRPLLEGAESVVHLAARVHLMRDTASDPLSAFRRDNCEATLRLAHAAVEAGVRRFVFVSSIKVNGEVTAAGVPFRSDQTPRPADAYGISKLEAELGLAEIGARTGLEIVVVRPPLVYGPQVRGNFASMMRWIERGVPLPFACAVHNKRSFIGVDNLTDFLTQALCHPDAPGRPLLVSDGQDLSTRELLEMLARALGMRARLLPVPLGWLRVLARIGGQGPAISRLLGNLQVDIEETKRRLAWSPPVSAEDGLRRTAVAAS